MLCAYVVGRKSQLGLGMVGSTKARRSANMDETKQGSAAGPLGSVVRLQTATLDVGVNRITTVFKLLLQECLVMQLQTATLNKCVNRIMTCTTNIIFMLIHIINYTLKFAM